MRENVVELCPNCGGEVEMVWDIKEDGYEIYCPYCGKKMMLCDACMHANDFKGCGYDCIRQNKFKVIDWYWERDADGVPIYITIEDNGFTRIVNLDEGKFWKACWEKYDDAENNTDEQLYELSKEMIEKDYTPMDSFPDIKDASPLVRELFDRVRESEACMGFLEVDEKEELEEKYEKSWGELVKQAREDIKKYHLEDVVEIGDEPLATGYGDLQTMFKY